MRRSFQRVVLVLAFLCPVAGQGQGTSGENELSTSVSNPWGLSAFGLSVVDRNLIRSPVPSVFTYSYLSFSYRLSRDERLSLRPVFLIDSAGSNRFNGDVPFRASTGDFEVTYVDYRAAEFAGIRLITNYYFDFPTSESAQTKKYLGILKGWFMFEKPLDVNWTLTYHNRPKVWLHRQRSYEYETVRFDANGMAQTQTRKSLNQLAQLEHSLEISRYMNRAFTPFAEVGLVHEWFPDEPEISRDPSSRNYLSHSVGTWINVNRALRFRAFMQGQADLRPGGKPFGLFRDEDTNYVVMTFISML